MGFSVGRMMGPWHVSFMFGEEYSLDFSWRPEWIWKKDHRGIHWLGFGLCAER